ncbi:heat- and acid-stable phosphoprotein [Musa troglodytarum]|uniref:Heat- and acid-stable phosphoprotein n=1 Tax=Musa troglodytarum TaxID=320322 RepID=A0A9E7JU11_9LILI|nr:heat- and acid-stable phosphoprotein [Musa troglodytarum]
MSAASTLLLSIAFNATIDGDLRLPQPHCTATSQQEAEYSEEEEPGEESGGDSEQETEKKKGILHISEIQNPNLVKPKNMKARAADVVNLPHSICTVKRLWPIWGLVESTPELSRREREEIERQKAHERYMRLQEQGKTEQARKDLERLALVRQQRAEAAKKRDEEKAAKEQKRAEARK